MTISRFTGFILACAMVMSLGNYVVETTSVTQPRSASAQDNPVCQEQLEATILEALQVCGAISGNQLCWSSGGLTVEPETSIQPDQPADLATLSDFALAYDNDNLPIARLSLVNDGDIAATAYALGNIHVAPAQDAIVSWLNLTLTTGHSDNNSTPDASECSNDFPPSGLLVQATPGQLLTLRVNDLKLTVNDTIFLTNGDGLTNVTVLRGNAIIEKNGDLKVVFAGYALTNNNEDALPEPDVLDSGHVAHLPTQLLPHIVLVPQPGNVTLTQASSLYTEPTENSAVLESLRAGTVLNILGQDPSGSWWHVVREDGVNGWVAATVVSGVLPTAAPQYQATPQPPTRPYGLVMGRAQTPGNPVNMRSAPNTDADVLAQLPALTQFSILGRNENADWLQVRLDEPVEDGIQEGWLAAWILDLPSSIRLADLPVATP